MPPLPVGCARGAGGVGGCVAGAAVGAAREARAVTGELRQALKQAVDAARREATSRQPQRTCLGCGGEYLSFTLDCSTCMHRFDKWRRPSRSVSPPIPHELADAIYVSRIKERSDHAHHQVRRVST